MNYTVPFGQLRMNCVELQTVGTSKTTCFGDKGAGGVVLLRKFDDYYNGYQDETGIQGEQNQKDFIALFGAILRMRNLLLSFDDFAEKEKIPERDLQDYLGKYQDLRDEWKKRPVGE